MHLLLWHSKKKWDIWKWRVLNTSLVPRECGGKWYRQLGKLFSAAKDRVKLLADQVSLTDQSCAQQTVFSGVAPVSAVRLLTCGSSAHRFYIRAKPLCVWVCQQIVFTHSGKFVSVQKPPHALKAFCTTPPNFLHNLAVAHSHPPVGSPLSYNHTATHAASRSCVTHSDDMHSWADGCHEWLVMLWSTGQRACLSFLSKSLAKQRKQKMIWNDIIKQTTMQTIEWTIYNVLGRCLATFSCQNSINASNSFSFRNCTEGTKTFLVKDTCLFFYIVIEVIFGDWLLSLVFFILKTG